MTYGEIVAEVIGYINNAQNKDIQRSLNKCLRKLDLEIFRNIYETWDSGLSGTHTAVAESNTVLTDTSKATAFPTDDTLVGMPISNSTDSSSGTIISNTADTVTVAALTGGTDNKFQNDDAYTIDRSVIPFDTDVIQITEIFLNDEKILPTMTLEDYINGSYQLNTVCHISNMRRIYFPVALSTTDVLKVKCLKKYTASTSLTSSEVIDLPDHYLDLLSTYILKELYSMQKYYNFDMFVKYNEEFNSSLSRTKAIKTYDKLIDFGGM